jgi:hypothetical protein
VSGFCEYSNEPSGSIKDGGFVGEFATVRCSVVCIVAFTVSEAMAECSCASTSFV